MKKTILITGAILLATAGSVVYGVNKRNSSINQCSNNPNGQICCPITPDCQPGDPNCICPMDCKK